MSTNRSERGGALLLVLWLSAALGAIALSVSTSVRTEIEHTSTVADGLRAHYLATGSLERGVQWMLWGAGPLDANNKPKFWDRRKPRMNMSYSSGDVVVEMIPETAKLNVNTATEEELVAIVKALTGDARKAEEVAAGIIDWRFPAQSQRSFDSYYLQLGPTFRPRHASLQEIEELLFVRGVTPEMFYGNYIADDEGRLYARGGLRDCLSVWGTKAAIDVNGASPALLEAIGVTPANARAIAQRRVQKPFETITELQEMGITNPRLRVGGNTMWTMRATARLKNPDGTRSETVRSASAVVKYWDDLRQHPIAVQVVRYYGDAWSEFAVAPPATQFVLRAF